MKRRAKRGCKASSSYKLLKSSGAISVAFLVFWGWWVGLGTKKDDGTTAAGDGTGATNPTGDHGDDPRTGKHDGHGPDGPGRPDGPKRTTAGTDQPTTDRRARAGSQTDGGPAKHGQTTTDPNTANRRTNRRHRAPKQANKPQQTSHRKPATPRTTGHTHNTHASPGLSRRGPFGAKAFTAPV